MAGAGASAARSTVALDLGAGLRARHLMLTLVRLMAWVVAIGLVAVTLSPLEARPVLAPPTLERAGAYALFGFLLVLSYPRRWGWALLVAVALAGGLEAAQGLTVSRHGRLIDFLVKGGAALAGGLAAQGMHLLLTRRAVR
ncbi:hypothetical protein OFEAOIEE_LOCUS549 [Methylorubrum extorquens]